MRKDLQRLVEKDQEADPAAEVAMEPGPLATPTDAGAPVPLAESIDKSLKLPLLPAAAAAC